MHRKVVAVFIVIVIVACCVATQFPNTPHIISEKVIPFESRTWAMYVWLDPNRVWPMPASHPARLKMPVYDVARGRWYENDFHKSRVDMQTLVTRMNSRVTQPSEYVEFDQAVLARMAAGAGGPFPPKYSTIVAKAVSEDASQMACVLVTEHYDPVFWQLKRIAPRLRLPHHTDGDLWVSKPDGANLQMVGTLIANVHISLDTPIKSVQWTPDNGKVSFVYEGALYLAPVK